MTRITPWILALAIAVACGSEDKADEASNGACVPNQSIACVGPGNCEGRQICGEDGNSYSDCDCSSGASTTTRNSGATQPSTGGVVSSTGGAGASYPNTTNRFGSSPVTSSPNGSSSGGALGTAGAPLGIAGTATQAPGTSPSSCAPVDMAQFTYPAYRPARRAKRSCSEAEVEKYYTECYSTGSCTAFQPGGASATCGECLTPSRLEDAEYGPILRLGPATTPMDITNMAGCIELLGEASCAKPMLIASLCEYYACADSCPNTSAKDYQAEMNCMSQARTTSCSSVGSQAVCITDPAHASACSGSGFANQFKAIARVFCVQGS